MADFADRKGPLSVEDEHLALYLKEISNIPLLTAEQEVQLAKEIKKGNQNANKRDYHQQFDQREVFPKSHCSPSFGANLQLHAVDLGR